MSFVVGVCISGGGGGGESILESPFGVSFAVDCVYVFVCGRTGRTRSSAGAAGAAAAVSVVYCRWHCVDGSIDRSSRLTPPTHPSIHPSIHPCMHAHSLAHRRVHSLPPPPITTATTPGGGFGGGGGRGPPQSAAGRQLYVGNLDFEVRRKAAGGGKGRKGLIMVGGVGDGDDEQAVQLIGRSTDAVA